MDKLKDLLKSRKFWAAVIALAVVSIKAFSPSFPFSEDQLLAVIGTLAAYILGVGLEDSAA
jgi:uncharacterized membrane protein YdjX (TVP38/TMEM64 family)